MSENLEDLYAVILKQLNNTKSLYRQYRQSLEYEGSQTQNGPPTQTHDCLCRKYERAEKRRKAASCNSGVQCDAPIKTSCCEKSTGTCLQEATAPQTLQILIEQYLHLCSDSPILAAQKRRLTRLHAKIGRWSIFKEKAVFKLIKYIQSIGVEIIQAQYQGIITRPDNFTRCTVWDGGESDQVDGSLDVTCQRKVSQPEHLDDLNLDLVPAVQITGTEQTVFIVKRTADESQCDDKVLECDDNQTTCQAKRYVCSSVSDRSCYSDKSYLSENSYRDKPALYSTAIQTEYVQIDTTTSHEDRQINDDRLITPFQQIVRRIILMSRPFSTSARRYLSEDVKRKASLQDEIFANVLSEYQSVHLLSSMKSLLQQPVIRTQSSINQSQASVMEYLNVLIHMSEIWFHIFKHLDVKSLLTAGQVCKEMRAASCDPRLWTHLRLFNERLDSRFLNNLSPRCTLLQHLTLDSIKPPRKLKHENMEDFLWRTVGILDPGLESLLSASKESLTHIRILHCSNLVTDKLLEMLPKYNWNLSSLTFTSIYHSATPELLWSLSTGCKNVRELDLSPPPVSAQTQIAADECCSVISRCWPSLRKLSIGGPGLTVNGLYQISQQCHQLIELEVWNGPNIDKQVIQQLTEKDGLKNIQKIWFRGRSEVTADALSLLRRKCKYLESQCTDERLTIKSDRIENPRTGSLPSKLKTTERSSDRNRFPRFSVDALK